MFKKVLLRSALLLLLCALNVYGAGAKTIRLTVKEELAACTGVAPMTCMQVKYKTSKSWELFYGAISGFRYEAGYRYVLLVDQVKRKSVPADASAYTYTLKKIVKKEKMPASSDSWSYVMKHQWKLIQMKGVVQEKSPVYMVFDSTGKRVSGNAGCNRFFGAYERTKDNISFKQMGSTLMACPNGLDQLEHSFRYDVADQTLNFYQGTQLVLMFGRAPLEK